LEKKYTNVVAIVNDNLADPRANEEDCSRCVDCKYGYSNGDTNGNEIIFCVKMKEFLYEETDMGMIIVLILMKGIQDIDDY